MSAPVGITQIDSAGDRHALNIKVYVSLLEAFMKKNIGLSLITLETITDGRTAQFPIAGLLTKDDVAEHSAGDTTIGGTFDFNERTIQVTARQYIRREIDDYEKKMAHYNTDAPIVKQMGEALSNKIDTDIFTAIDALVSATAVTSQGAAGVTTTAAGYTAATDPEVKGNFVLNAIFEADASMDERDISTEGRVFVTDRQTFANLILSTKAVNVDYNPEGNGSIRSGKIVEIAGRMVAWTNNLPATTVTTKALGYLFTPDALGMVELVGVSYDSWFDKDVRKDVMYGEMGYGLGALNPACLQVIAGD